MTAGHVSIIYIYFFSPAASCIDPSICTQKSGSDAQRKREWASERMTERKKKKATAKKNIQKTHLIFFFFCKVVKCKVMTSDLQNGWYHFTAEHIIGMANQHQCWRITKNKNSYRQLGIPYFFCGQPTIMLWF